MTFYILNTSSIQLSVECYSVKKVNFIIIQEEKNKSFIKRHIVFLCLLISLRLHLEFCRDLPIYFSVWLVPLS